MIVDYDILINVQPSSQEPGRPAVNDADRYGDGELGGYREGDQMVCTYQGGTIDGWVDEATAEMLFMRHNRDDRPDGKDGPSLSVGDVVVIHGVATSGCRVHVMNEAFAVHSAGFRKVPVPGPDKVEMDRTWSEMVQVIRDSRWTVTSRSHSSACAQCDEAHRQAMTYAGVMGSLGSTFTYSGPGDDAPEHTVTVTRPASVIRG